MYVPPGDEGLRGPHRGPATAAADAYLQIACHRAAARVSHNCKSTAGPARGRRGGSIVR